MAVTGIRELLRVAPVIEDLGERFLKAGYELALVGGSVRDAMLERLGNDLDFATSARPQETKRLLTGWADAVWDVGQAFGTIGARVDPYQIEITTYRSDTYDPQSRKPDVAYGDSLTEDLKRRDFSFVGPTICYAFMQSAGLVNDHQVDCFRWREVGQAAPG